MSSEHQRKVSSRKRPVSCQFCRTRKLRCSRTAPCTSCVSRNTTCDLEYPVAQPAGDAGGSEILERLHRLERLLLVSNTQDHEDSTRNRTAGDPRRIFSASAIASQSTNVDVVDNVAWLVGDHTGSASLVGLIHLRGISLISHPNAVTASIC